MRQIPHRLHKNITECCRYFWPHKSEDTANLPAWISRLGNPSGGAARSWCTGHKASSQSPQNDQALIPNRSMLGVRRYVAPPLRHGEAVVKQVVCLINLTRKPQNASLGLVRRRQVFRMAMPSCAFCLSLPETHALDRTP